MNLLVPESGFAAQQRNQVPGQWPFQFNGPAETVPARSLYILLRSLRTGRKLRAYSIDATLFHEDFLRSNTRLFKRTYSYAIVLQICTIAQMRRTISK